MDYGMGYHAQRTGILKRVRRNLPDGYTAEWRGDQIEVWQRSPQHKVGSIHHIGVDKFTAFVFAGDKVLTHDTATPAEAATWIVGQLGLRPDSNPDPGIDSLLGAFRGATGGMSSVDFVRATRDSDGIEQ